MHGEQRQYSQRGPLPSLLDWELRHRLTIGCITGGFFLPVKTELKARDVAQQGWDEAVCSAVGFPETKGQMAGREKKNPFFLFPIGSKSLWTGAAYPERRKKVGASPQTIAAGSGERAATERMA